MLGKDGVSMFSGAVLAIGIISVSTASIFTRYAQVEAASLVIAAYRLVIASLVLAPIACRRYGAELRSLQPVEWLLAVTSGVFLAIHFATWVSSLEYTSVASSVVLVTTSPLWVALAAWLLLHERLTRRVIFGLIVAFCGVIVIGLTDTMQEAGSAPSLGNLLALTGAFMVAGYWLIGRRLRAKIPLIPYVAVVYSTAAIILLVATGVARQPLTGYEPVIYLWFLLLGLVPQLIGHSSFNWALARLPATFVSVATLGEPIGSTVLAYFFLSETPSFLKVLGSTLVLTGILFTLLSQVKVEAVLVRIR